MEISRTEIVSPQDPVTSISTPAVSAVDNAGRIVIPISQVSGNRVEEVGLEMSSHRWTVEHNNVCIIPLPEEGSERSFVEVEVDLWEAGEKGKEKGDHLGQVHERCYVLLHLSACRATNTLELITEYT